MSGDDILGVPRPEGMGPAENVLWEAMAAGVYAAYSRLLSASADTLSPAALNEMAFMDAAQAVEPHVARIAHTVQMRAAIQSALARDGVASARHLYSVAPPIGGGLPS